jgi:hypothetical protein
MILFVRKLSDKNYLKLKAASSTEQTQLNFLGNNIHNVKWGLLSAANLMLLI